MASNYHQPVMVNEVLDALKCGGESVQGVSGERIYVDGTAGCGGHTLEILKRTKPTTAKVVCIDRDKEALEVARAKLKNYKDRVMLVHDNFSEIKRILKKLGIGHVDGILLDLGLSSLQLERGQRGFSFQKDGPLDMRMDQNNRKTAFDIVNLSSEEELKDIIRNYGEERWAAKIAKRIIEKRALRPISTTGELAELVFSCIPRRFHPKRIHPATKTFQAIRIALNDELQNIKKCLGDGVDALAMGGRFCVISYHSLEDRIVKSMFRACEQGCTCPPSLPECVCGFVAKLKVITKRPLRPSEDEVTLNPRSRSAKLRVAEKVLH
jgi:16S rRNA (cytosine1402-N4)-methyltransferase